MLEHTVKVFVLLFCKPQRCPPHSLLNGARTTGIDSMLYSLESSQVGVRDGKHISAGRDSWRHHQPQQECHRWTETRKQQTTNENRSGSITLHLRLVSDFTSPTTPSIANFWREKLESVPPEVCCDPKQPDLESTTIEISDITSSHSNTEVKLEPAAEDLTTTGFRQIAQVLTMMEKSMRESQEKILGALMASQERQDQQMLELMAVLGQRGVESGGPETLLQSSAALLLKPLKSTKVDNDTFFQDHFAPDQGTYRIHSRPCSLSHCMIVDDCKHCTAVTARNHRESYQWALDTWNAYVAF
ncbi:hypothetical protein CAPTEDRAFT_215740 [Capitella teleta]|uniref:Uncharacterized protein n=1 Tax=Capitella teleta TaxID=283909 RepID=R7VHM1_CAPTE|nr:hypothetical protein CAPTEDRAFT_215740 [Capitella teleta]|eukprot:ELU15796.1 hypothetical protein CAPTEDRAFT_215740 [Capitella teleta]